MAHFGAISRLTEELVKIAKEKNLQLFVETHSDHIINGLRIAVKHEKCSCNDVKILHFVKEKGQSPYIVPILVDKDGNLSDYPDDFMDEWTNQMVELV